jgi:hypothetical protein
MNFKFGEESKDKDTNMNFEISVSWDATPENLTPFKRW